MKVQDGSTVKVHYKGTLSDGTVFDSSEGRDPLEFVFGKGQLIKGFEKAVEGLAAGQDTKVEIPAAEAYGEKRDELVMTVPKDKFPAEIPKEVGQPLTLRHPNGGTMDALITEVKDTEVILDANHPLAGKALTFEISVVEVA